MHDWHGNYNIKKVNVKPGYIYYGKPAKRIKKKYWFKKK